MGKRRRSMFSVSTIFGSRQISKSDGIDNNYPSNFHLSFKQSLLAFLPCTKANKEVKKNLWKLDSLEIYTAEQDRTSSIKRLVQEGRHDIALRTLLDDTTESCDLRYWNNLKWLEEKNTSSPPKNVREDRVSVTRDEHEVLPSCTWQGFNEIGVPVRCINAVFIHPWKMHIDVMGIEKNVTTKSCHFHQKYCVNKERHHLNSQKKIMVPNLHALCNECYVLRMNSPPPLRCQPGLRKVGSSLSKTVERS